MALSREKIKKEKTEFKQVKANTHTRLDWSVCEGVVVGRRDVLHALSQISCRDVSRNGEGAALLSLLVSNPFSVCVRDG